MTTLKVDAVVNCKNVDINVRSGVSGQLFVAAGPQLDDKATAEKAAANKAADAKAAAEKATAAAVAEAAALRREIDAVRAAVEMAAAEAKAVAGKAAAEAKAAAEKAAAEASAKGSTHGRIKGGPSQKIVRSRSS